MIKVSYQTSIYRLYRKSGKDML